MSKMLVFFGSLVFGFAIDLTICTLLRCFLVLFISGAGCKKQGFSCEPIPRVVKDAGHQLPITVNTFGESAQLARPADSCLLPYEPWATSHLKHLRGITRSGPRLGQLSRNSSRVRPSRWMRLMRLCASRWGPPCRTGTRGGSWFWGARLNLGPYFLLEFLDFMHCIQKVWTCFWPLKDP